MARIRLVVALLVVVAACRGVGEGTVVGESLTQTAPAATHPRVKTRQAARAEK